MEKVAVTLEIPTGEGKPAYKHTYEKQKATTVGDCQTISREQAEGDTDDEKKKSAAEYLVKAFNYGHDLLLRANERAKANRAAQGPEKEIAKAVEMLAASGFDKDEARKLIIAQREAKGLPV